MPNISPPVTSWQAYDPRRPLIGNQRYQVGAAALYL